MRFKFSDEIDIQLFIEMVFVVILVAISNIIGNLIIGYPISLNYKWFLILTVLAFAVRDVYRQKHIALWRFSIFALIIFGLVPSTFVSYGGLNILIISYIITIAVGTAFLCDGFQRVFLLISLFLISISLYSIQFIHYGIDSKILSDMISAEAIAKDMPLQLIINLSISTYIATRFSNVWRKEHQTLLKYSDQLEESNKILEHRATHDELTSVYNRHYLIHYYNELSINRNGHLLIVDIDDFKAVNDTYGHNAGDELLKSIAKAFGKLVDEKGFVSRIGGDEFVIFLYDLNDKEIESFMSRFDQSFLNFYIEEHYRVTISGGIIKIDPDKTLSENLNNADKLLYKAKRNGKQKIEYLENLISV